MSKRRKSKVAVLLSIAIMGYFGYVLVGQESLIREKQHQISSINQKIDDEKSLNTELKKQKDKVSTDEYAEKVAREKLGMVKPEEKIFVDVNK